MKDYVEYIVLAIIQGVTEFLPISSSGHIEIFKKTMNNPTILEHGGFITVILHFATALSIICVFRKKIKELLFLNTKKTNQYLCKILISTIPILCLALLGFEEKINQLYNQGWNLNFISLMFLLTGIILIISEKIKLSTKKINFFSAFIIGCVQAIAILPGISRSGVTICCALLLGATKKESSTFSFLICLPIILGKTIKDLINKDIIESIEFNFPIILSFLIAFFVGLICCTWMIKIVNKSKLKYFGIYCFITASMTLIIASLEL